MGANTHIHQIASECISQDVMIKYINGELDGRMMNRIERHLSVCPMCADEMEGLQQLDNPEEIKAISEDLNSQIDHKIYKKERKIRVAYIARVAAVLVLVMSVSVLVIYFLNINRNDNFLSENTHLEQAEEELPQGIASMQGEEILKEEIDLEEKTIVKDAIPKSPPPAPEVVDNIEILEDDIEIAAEISTEDFAFVADETIALEGREEIPVTQQESVVISGGVAQQQPVSASSKGPESMKREKAVSEIIYVYDSDEEADSTALGAGDDNHIAMNFAEEEEVVEEEVFVMVEQMPYFTDSNGDDFNTYLLKNRRYPEEAAENGIQGKVYVEFFVERDGSISNVKVIRGVDPMLDKEAVRLVESCPRWKPGMQRGRPVRVKMSVPITFEIH